MEAAFQKLGCTVEEGKPGRADRIIRWKKHVAVIEVKGLAKSAREKDSAQLEKWVSEHAIDTGEQPKGLLIVNAWRNTALDEREEPPFPPQMLPYSEQREHCLLTTAQLLAALLTATSKEKRATFLGELFETNGVLDGWAWADAVTLIKGDTAE